MITVLFSKAQELFELLNNSFEDEPICVICDYRCPYSTYEDGQYCERDNPGFQCWSSFLDWLKKGERRMSLRKETPCDFGSCPYDAEYHSTCEYWCGAEEPEDYNDFADYPDIDIICDEEDA